MSERPKSSAVFCLHLFPNNFQSLDIAANKLYSKFKRIPFWDSKVIEILFFKSFRQLPKFLQRVCYLRKSKTSIIPRFKTKITVKKNEVLVSF